MTKEIIGVYGNKPFMPNNFPLAFPENAGNMIHARAPMRELKDSTVEFFGGTWKVWKDGSFANFVNRRCDGLVVTMANTIRTNDSDGAIYTRFKRMLDQYKVPLTIFGLGARSATEKMDDIELLPECIDLLQYLERRAAPIGVRGEFTKRLLAEKAGVTEVVVTGCPSFFSEPAAFAELRKNLDNPQEGVITFSGTNFNRSEELGALVDTALNGGHLIEPVSKDLHRAHLMSVKGKTAAYPNYVRRAINRLDGAARQKLEIALGELLKNRYHLFHEPEAWLDFNRKVVEFGYGTRFHVNMATLLSGKPALWVTHDSRTRELVDFFGLPSIDLSSLPNKTPEQLMQLVDYEPMFSKLPDLFANWEGYMTAHDLPYKKPSLVY